MRRCCLLWVWLAALSATAAAQSAGDASIIGGRQVYVVRAGDTLTAIAARHAVTPAAIAALNGIATTARIKPGQELRVDNPHIAIADTRHALTINIPQRMLFFRDGAQVAGYPVTVGKRDWPTPVGEFTVVLKEKDPTWDVPASIQREMASRGDPVIFKMPPSAENPLGARWLGLSLPGLGIHGTNAPSSIYRYGSHGCIRMHPDHVAELFERVATGITGVLIYEPIILAVIDGRVWLEVHPDPYRRVGDPAARLRALAGELSATALMDWPAAAAALQQRDGRAEDITRRAGLTER